MSKSAWKVLFFSFGCVLLSLDVAAQTVGSCTDATATSILRANNVRTMVRNNGSLIYNAGSAVHEVPYGSGKHSMFAAGLWLGGTVDGELRTAASTYGPFEFWPGPYNSAIGGGDCTEHDRIYSVTIRDIQALDDSGIPSDDIRDWPWQLGAPVVDGDGNPDNYNLASGDRPLLRGDEMRYWIMNDAGNVHQSTGTDPLGVEVHMTVFATSDGSNPHYGNTVFYEFRIINRSADVIDELHVGLYSDAEIGNGTDDYGGSSPDLNLAYAYNGNTYDNVYGSKPPAVGIQVIGGLSPSGAAISSSSALVFRNGGGVDGSPTLASDYYNYSRGRLKDGSSPTEGGSGRGYSETPVSFMFPGDPEKMEFWTAVNSDNMGTSVSPADVRFVNGVGPMTLSPSDEVKLYVANISAFGTDNLNSVTVLKEAAASFVNLNIDTVPVNIAIRKTPQAAPTILSPGNGAISLPLDMPLRWDWGGGDVEFTVEYAQNPAFSASQVMIVDRLSAALNLEENQRYWVRVRAGSAYGEGPWSDVVSFTTGETNFSEFNPIEDIIVVANAGGILNPAVGASADYAGFPGAGLPTADQQIGEARWLLHAFDSSVTPRISYASFLDWALYSLSDGVKNFIGYDYEIRFTDGGRFALGLDARGFPELVQVPFEIWRVAHSSGGSATNDYVRLIPEVIDWDGDGWGIQCFDHSVSPGNDDPETDAIRIRLPNDLSSGDTGYQEWLAGAQESEILLYEFGSLAITSLALINLDGGDVSSCTAPQAWNSVSPSSTGFNQDIPEAGTVFRIESATPPIPVGSSPAAGEILPAGVNSFSWSAYSDVVVKSVDVALDIDMIDKVAQIPLPIGSSTTIYLGAGTYYWTVTDQYGGISAPIRFEVVNSPANVLRPQFLAGITVAEGSSTSILAFGMYHSATSGYDAGTDQFAPPAPPAGVSDARLLRDSNEYLIDAVSSSNDSATWRLIFQTGGTSPVVSWNPDDLPPPGSFRMTDAFDGTPFHNVDMRTMSSLTPTAGVTQLLISYSTAIDVDVSVIAGWNLIGLPVAPQSRAVGDLFDSALEGTFFGFTNTYVVPQNSELRPGAGYWLRFAEGANVRVSGERQERLTVDLNEGWNMISPPSCTIPYSGIGGDDILLDGTLFQWSSAYTVSSSLEAGKGYWIRASADGTITLDCAASTGKRDSEPAALASLTRLNFRDADGRAQQLFVGQEPDAAVHPQAFSVPPTSPNGDWQAAFQDGRYVSFEIVSTVDLNGSRLPIAVTADGNETLSLEMMDASGRVLESVQLASSQTAWIESAKVARVAFRRGDDVLPSDFAIEGSFPNPFSRSSTVRYSLPEGSDVSIGVYDMLGRRVVTLVNEQHQSAGWHDVLLTSERLASGSYVLRFKAGGHTDVHRVVVVR